MKKSFSFSKVTLFLLCASYCLAGTPPSIKHSPVQAGVRGQPILIRATVKDQSDKLKAVNLHSSVSSDAAPYKVKMTSSGSGAYIGSIPATLTANAAEVKYYIEAINEMDETTETAWHTVALEVRLPAPKTAAPVPVPVAPSHASDTKKSSYRTPLLIGGGIALAAGGAALAVNLSDKDKSGDSSSSSSETNAGSYAGTATRYTTVEGNSPTAMSYLTTIVVLSSGRVTSDDLHPETHLEATLADTDFVMSATLSGETTGEIRYSGTISHGKVTGSILGSGVTTNGTNVSYSGIFSAVKQ